DRVHCPHEPRLDSFDDQEQTHRLSTRRQVTETASSGDAVTWSDGVFRASRAARWRRGGFVGCAFVVGRRVSRLASGAVATWWIRRVRVRGRTACFATRERTWWEGAAGATVEAGPTHKRRREGPGGVTLSHVCRRLVSAYGNCSLSAYRNEQRPSASRRRDVSCRS